MNFDEWLEKPYQEPVVEFLWYRYVLIGISDYIEVGFEYDGVTYGNKKAGVLINTDDLPEDLTEEVVEYIFIKDYSAEAIMIAKNG